MPDQRLHTYSKFFLAIFCTFIVSAGCHAEGATKKYEKIPGSLYDFYNSLGVCAHVTVYSSSYSDKHKTLSQLQYLDINSVRDDVRGPFNQMLETYQFYARHGIRFTTIVGKYVPDPSGFREELKLLSPYLEAIEGGNEVDHPHNRVSPDQDVRKIYERAIEHQRNLYKTVKSLPETKTLPVYNFTVVMNDGVEELRTLIQNDIEKKGPLADYDTLHSYDQTGKGPYDDTLTHIKRYSLIPDLPQALTETGYTTIDYGPQNAHKNGWRGISKEVSTKLLLSTISATYKWGMKKIFVFQLNDSFPDPKHLDKERHFGLFDYEGNPKPAAVALRNMRLIMKGTDSEIEKETNDNPFVWYVTQDNSNEDYDFERHHLLLREGKNRHILIVWAEPELWDTKNHKPLEKEPKGNNIQISFEHTPKIIRIYDPLAGAGAILQYNDTNNIKFLVKDHPIILEITSP